MVKIEHRIIVFSPVFLRSDGSKNRRTTLISESFLNSEISSRFVGNQKEKYENQSEIQNTMLNKRGKANAKHLFDESKTLMKQRIE